MSRSCSAPSYRAFCSFVIGLPPKEKPRRNRVLRGSRGCLIDVSPSDQVDEGFYPLGGHKSLKMAVHGCLAHFPFQVPDNVVKGTFDGDAVESGQSPDLILVFVRNGVPIIVHRVSFENTKPPQLKGRYEGFREVLLNRFNR